VGICKKSRGVVQSEENKWDFRPHKGKKEEWDRNPAHGVGEIGYTAGEMKKNPKKSETQRKGKGVGVERICRGDAGGTFRKKPETK